MVQLERLSEALSVVLCEKVSAGGWQQTSQRSGPTHQTCQR